MGGDGAVEFVGNNYASGVFDALKGRCPRENVKGRKGKIIKTRMKAKEFEKVSNDTCLQASSCGY